MTRRARALYLLLAAILIGLFVRVVLLRETGDPSFARMPPQLDREERCRKLDSSAGEGVYDLSVLVGMPENYKDSLLQYSQAVAQAIAAPRLTRRRYFHHQGESLSDSYPDVVNPVFDRDVVVPVVLLPRPEAVKTWSSSSQARVIGWRAENSVTATRGTVYGRTVIFKPGIRSLNPLSPPPAPFETRIPSRNRCRSHFC